jgi:hypothetical protein
MNKQKSDKKAQKPKSGAPLPKIGKGMTAVEIPADVAQR